LYKQLYVKVVAICPAGFLAKQSHPAVPDSLCLWRCRCCGFIGLQVKPIAVADMLGLSNPAKSNAADASSVTSAVQGFLNNVVAAAGYGAAVESHQQLKQSLTRSIMAPRASTDLDNAAARVSASGGADGTGQQQDEPVVVVTGEVSDDDEDEERGTFHLAGSGDSGSLATYSSSGTPEAAAVAASPAAAGSTGGAAAAAHAGGATAAAPHGAVLLPASVALLHKDAFLVFRALCKLSIRTSDLVTVSDPTAVRGKVRPCEADMQFCSMHAMCPAAEDLIAALTLPTS
jgi:brefeldin A-inhibited guanine nucleotide-exchange protein